MCPFGGAQWAQDTELGKTDGFPLHTPARARTTVFHVSEESGRRAAWREQRRCGPLATEPATASAFHGSPPQCVDTGQVC
jgi:hypothetical protein